MSLFNDIKDFFKTGRLEILQKQTISEEIKNEVSDLVEYVYSKGESPVREMPSIKYQKHLLAQVFAMGDLESYEALANSVYESTVSKENTYAQISDENELTQQMHFAFENLCYNIIQLSKDNEHARKYWATMDNLSERLLQINHDKFKKLFITMHEWHFGWVYKFDTDYKYTIENIKRRLLLCHGIKQTDFYDREHISRNDLQFTLYFAEKAGEIKRIQDGRTYRLYLPDDNIEEVPKYEFTRSSTTDGCFDYKKYWKDVEKKVKENLGIRQTDFYKLFSWDSEVVACTLRAAEKDGKLIREKNGNTYSLYLPEKQ